MPLEPGDHRARQSLAEYIARAPLSLQSLTYDASGAMILYHTSYNPYFKQNTTLWDATDFIAALTQFIPPWGVRHVRYYGLYSSRCKARWQLWPHVARVAPTDWKDSHAAQLPTDPAPRQPQRIPPAACRSAWARLIAKVYEIDLSGGSHCPAGALARREGGRKADSGSPMVCPRCGSDLRLIAVITEPSEVRKILRHLVKISRAPPGLDASALN